MKVSQSRTMIRLLGILVVLLEHGCGSREVTKVPSKLQRCFTKRRTIRLMQPCITLQQGNATECVSHLCSQVQWRLPPLNVFGVRDRAILKQHFHSHTESPTRSQMQWRMPCYAGCVNELAPVFLQHHFHRRCLPDAAGEVERAPAVDVDLSRRVSSQLNESRHQRQKVVAHSVVEWTLLVVVESTRVRSECEQVARELQVSLEDRVRQGCVVIWQHPIHGRVCLAENVQAQLRILRVHSENYLVKTCHCGRLAAVEIIDRHRNSSSSISSSSSRITPLAHPSLSNMSAGEK